MSKAQRAINIKTCHLRLVPPAQTFVCAGISGGQGIVAAELNFFIDK